MKTRIKITHTCMLLAFAMVVFIWAVLMFWWLYPYKTVDIKSQPYIVNTHEIKRGENLEYIVDYCRYTYVNPIVEKQFIDGIIFTAPDSNTQLPYGCGNVVVVVKIPETLPLGIYKLKVYTSFQVNPIRVITKDYETEKFNVIPN